MRTLLDKYVGREEVRVVLKSCDVNISEAAKIEDPQPHECRAADVWIQVERIGDSGGVCERPRTLRPCFSRPWRLISVSF